MTALLVILGSLFAVGCLVGIGYCWVDFTRDKQRTPSDQDWEPDVSGSKPHAEAEIPSAPEITERDRLT